MDEQTPPARPRLAFGRGQSREAAPSRKHVPVEDALARMAGKIGERRRASALGRGADDEDEGVAA